MKSSSLQPARSPSLCSYLLSSGQSMPGGWTIAFPAGRRAVGPLRGLASAVERFGDVGFMGWRGKFVALATRRRSSDPS